MNLCICVSGQIRDNNHSAFAALQSLVSQLHSAGHETQLIFSVWSEVSRKLDGVINLKQLRKIFVADLVNLIPPTWYGRNLWKKLPAVYQYITENEERNAGEFVQRYFPDAIVDVEDGDLMHLAFDQEVSDNNSIKMLYKIWRANEIKKGVERRRNKKFDFVVRVRPDFSLLKISLDLPPGALAIPKAKANHSTLEDTFAMGSSTALDYYSELFAKSISSEVRWRGIHSMLSDHLKQPSQFTLLPAEECGFVFRHMPANAEKIDLDELMLDLRDDFFLKVFEIIKLSRAAGAKNAVLAMEPLASQPMDADNTMIYYMLLHEICWAGNNPVAALKALLLADLNTLPINPKRMLADHRLTHIRTVIDKLLAQLNLENSSELINVLDRLAGIPFVDQAFTATEKRCLACNLAHVAAVSSGKTVSYEEPK